MNDRTRWLFGILIIVVVVWLSFTTVLSYVLFRQLGDIQIAQNVAIQSQNDNQICAQYEIILAMQELAEGFEETFGTPPLTALNVPDISGIDCEKA